MVTQNAINTGKPIEVANGGTSLATLTSHALYVGAGTSAPTALSVGTTGQLLVGATTADPAFASSASADFTFTTATAGATRTLTVSNTDNSNAASNALVQTTTGGSSAGDPFHTFTITGQTNFSLGLDNSDSDAFVIAASTALGTTNTVRIQKTGEMNFPLQSAFSAYLATSDNDKTGTGTAFTIGSATALTVIFDQNSDFNTNGTYTAPITARIQFNAAVTIGGCTICTGGQFKLITSNRTYFTQLGKAASSNAIVFNLSALADLDAADIANIQVFTVGEGADTDDITGSSSAITYMNGFIAC